MNRKDEAFAVVEAAKYNGIMASSALIEQMVEPIGRVLTQESATELLGLRADAVTQQRIDELAEKCNSGTLTDEERAEYQEFISVFNILTVLQTRARTLLETSHGPNGHS